MGLWNRIKTLDLYDELVNLLPDSIIAREFIYVLSFNTMWRMLCSGKNYGL